VKEKQLEGKVTPAWVRKKWENLKQKYKVITCFVQLSRRKKNFIDIRKSYYPSLLFFLLLVVLVVKCYVLQVPLFINLFIKK